MTIDKLKELTFEEFIAIVPSRQRRSFKRGLSMEHAKIITDSNNKPDTVIRTHRREMIIIPQLVGRTFSVYNGREFVNIEILPGMLAQVDIVNGQRSVMDYLLEPVFKVTNEAFREK